MIFIDAKDEDFPTSDAITVKHADISAQYLWGL